MNKFNQKEISRLAFITNRENVALRNMIGKGKKLSKDKNGYNMLLLRKCFVLKLP